MGQGSMRRRGKDAWELRVYQGMDPDTRRQRRLTKPVHGTERFARCRLLPQYGQLRATLFGFASRSPR